MLEINRRRMQGLLYGVALGDAFGMATEMLKRDTIKSLVNNKILNMDNPAPSLEASVISKNRPGYSITDDTMNTLMILEMLKECRGKVDASAYLGKLKKWTNNSPIAGYVTGPSTSRALKAIEEGSPVGESGKFGTTNGAAMKISPIGLISDYLQAGDLVKNVAEICKPTHNTSIAISGASAVAAAVSYFYMGGRSLDEMYEIIYGVVDMASSYGYQWPSASLNYRIGLARSLVESYEVGGRGVEKLLDRLYDEIGCTMETIDTVPVALALVKLSGGDGLECARMSAAIGGDTDTIGAIAVGICGVYRPETIPGYMIREIEKVNKINFSKYLL